MKQTEMFGKNAFLVVLFNDNQMSKSCDCETCKERDKIF